MAENDGTGLESNWFKPLLRSHKYSGLTSQVHPPQFSNFAFIYDSGYRNFLNTVDNTH